MRTNVYIDGFNLYHALTLDHHKWLDLRKLSSIFVPPTHYTLQSVYFFTAYATWLPDSYKRHRAYIAALEHTGVTPVLGQFKKKDRRCPLCKGQVRGHEEKESDINIGITMLADAFSNAFDQAILISSDSDFCPVVRMVKSKYPSKRIRIVTPRALVKSYDLVNAAGGRGHYKQILPVHFERCLLPEEVRDAAGNVVAMRPTKYDPPANKD